MRHPELKASAAVLLLLGIALALSLPYIGTTRIDRISYSIQPTASVYRLSLPLKGLPYLSQERLRSEALISRLYYIDYVSSTFADGGMMMDLGFRDGGVLALAPSDAVLVFDDGSASVSLDDLPSLMKVYPAAIISEEAMEYYRLFGFDFDALRGAAQAAASSTPEAIDDNVYSESADMLSIGMKG